MQLKNVFIALAMVVLAPVAFAHCDWVKGPVVADAQAALAKGDVTPVLKWIAAGDEAEIRSAFARTLAARATGAAARELADQWFFETVVRVHRATEGESFTGLKGESYRPEAGIEMADHAIDSGSLADMEKKIMTSIQSELRERFAEAMEAKKHAGESVEAGRHFVHVYAEFVHYVEELHKH
jgi:hypothetical protein